MTESTILPGAPKAAGPAPLPGTGSRLSSDAGDAFWTVSNEEALRATSSRPSGLTAAESAERLARYGPNLAVVKNRRGLLAKLGKRLAEPLIAILLIAAVLSGATGDWQSFILIVVIVLFSILLDIVQEQKAESAVDALRHSVAVTASVRRDGKAVELPVRDIVPGDVVELRSGNLVPADGVLLSGRGALVNEAMLTGEPYSVEKRTGPAAGLAPNDAFNALFSGTSIVGGEAVMLVIATGGKTRFGAIAASLQARQPPTALERGVHGLGMLILRLTGFLVLFVLLTQVVHHGLSLESFMFAVALAVGLTPELLPMVMTVTLARGAVRMAERKVVVKRLSAIHDLGAMDVLCTDKTGTLTEARITHVGSVGPDGLENTRVAELVRLNSHFVSGMQSNLDDAINAGPMPAGDWRCLDDLPFDFERRRCSVLVSSGSAPELITKGAPEAILAICSDVEAPDGTPIPLDEAMRAKLVALFEEKGRQGLRLLAVARRAMPPDCSKVEVDAEAGLVFVGCAIFVDPPKASATEAVARLMEAGVAVKIISGDAAAVVLHLVETLHLPAQGILSGDEIASLSEAALIDRVGRTNLFVRISPDQKSRIVRALRRAGHTVGFIGDGINDAPAIHAADVGLSVEGGTDVAREAADIILLAPDLGVLGDGIVEGRRTYANIMKYIRMGTSSNFGNMLSMALASLILPFLPLAPLQILLNNLIYDVSEIGIPFDVTDREMLAAPQAWDMKAVLRFTLIMGPLSSLFDIATFILLHWGFASDVAVFRTAWFVESISTQILVIFVIRTARPLWASRPHPVLVATSLGALAAALFLALSPLGAFVGFVPLPAPTLLAVIGISAAYLASAAILKRIAMPSLAGK
ncbi:magnesium-translocating P-type ATPase [Labrys monachus]|uniref:Magnesium-transporting ATPase, P-type 1 n=1 Tax=Labrys monachus TaxID=217067 RepID=A0ABU0F8X1_9HYPH|nr:magnesium-translocating P-type ATPase [Labrys monachus]MDQ0391059.1 Mg2+-importing ATPase [Labrys monachus]